MPYDVAIIGGGITGCAIARELSRYQLHVAVIEKECEVGFGTSKANSGIIHAGHHAALTTLKGQLEWEGNQMWDTLADELRHDIGVTAPYAHANPGRRDVLAIDVLAVVHSDRERCDLDLLVTNGDLTERHITTDVTCEYDVQHGKILLK